MEEFAIELMRRKRVLVSVPGRKRWYIAAFHAESDLRDLLALEGHRDYSIRLVRTEDKGSPWRPAQLGSGLDTRTES